MPGHGVFPATSNLIDGFQLQLTEPVCILFDHRFVVNPVVKAGQQALGGFRVKLAQVLFCQFLGAVLAGVIVNPGDREFCKKTDLGGDNFIFAVLETIGDVQNLGFKGQQYVANAALNKGGGGATAAAVKHPDTAQEVCQELVNLCFVVTEGILGVSQCGQIGVTAIAGGFRIRHDQGNIITNQVIPVLDVLRVVLAYQERHGGIVGGTVVWQTLCPVFRDQASAFVQDVDIGNLVKGGYVCLEALDNGLCLA